MDQEEQYIQKRLIDLSKRAEAKNIVTFSNFLNLNELNILHQTKKELYSSFQVSGGYDYAERQMAAFIPDALYYAWEYPMAVVSIRPSHPKFAEQLTHRDVLGACMNLGIKREMLGDILMQEEGAILFCVDSICGYLTENCTMIRHTAVSCSQRAAENFSYEPEKIERESIVSSFRLDAVLADICRLPRDRAKKLISEGSVFVNAKKILKNDYACAEGDILSVRHYGKFQLELTGRTTKKGRMKYKYYIYS